jgi:hypothetical protein
VIDLELLRKASKVKHPGIRGGKFWTDAHGNIRYDERPTTHPHKYLAYVVMSDGTRKYIVPKPSELDENGQVIGGQPKIREIINREFFGEHGFHSNGKFWQKEGLLFSYKPRTTRSGKVVVDEIQKHKGYIQFEFRDSSVARAYGGTDDSTLPQKIAKYKVTEAQAFDPKTGVTEKLPDKSGADEPPMEGTADIPVDEMGIRNEPRRLPQTQVALGEPLTEEENPIDLAHAYLELFLSSKKPSQAKTERGREKARAERKGRYDEIVGARRVRNVESLPAWILNKYNSPEELQHELGRETTLVWTQPAKVGTKHQTERKRAMGGRPLTTLITFGLWNPSARTKRHREQLEKEWRPYIRRWVRQHSGVYAATDTYQKFGEGVDKQAWMRDRERDLYNQAVAVLLHTADTYVSNDEMGTIDARFDTKAANEIKKEMRRMSRDSALELGATALEDLSEDDHYHSPKTISPREHFELRHFGEKARKILDEAMEGLGPEARATFESALWLDEEDAHPDVSQERLHAERRERQRLKYGKSRVSWGRPWIRTAVHHDGAIASVSDRLADTVVQLRNGKFARLSSLKPQHQRYYLEQWYNDAIAHISQRLKTPSGALTPDGTVVERWLRLEQKLAHVNIKEIEARVNVPVAKVSIKPPESVERLQEHPSVTFFRNNQDLARKLGISNNLDLPPTLKNVKEPTSAHGKLQKLSTYHQLYENVQKLPDIAAVHAQAREMAEHYRSHGHWTVDLQGNPSWHEGDGVMTLHEAAVKLHQTKGEDKMALRQFTSAANTLSATGEHPMVTEYKNNLRALGTAVPTNSDLARWKAHAHSKHRDAMNRLHVIEFVAEQRLKKSTVNDLVRAFHNCVFEFRALAEVVS